MNMSWRSWTTGMLLATTVAGCGQDAPTVPPVPSGGDAGQATSAGAPTAGGGAGASSGGAAPLTSEGGASGSVSNEAGAGGVAEPLLDPSAELYDPDSVPRFELDLPPESVQALQRAPDVYVRGSLRYGTEEIADIGVRIKGEGSLRTLAEKAAFKLKFDEFVSKQTFHGLRRMTFNNMVEDPTFIAERLAYHFFREVGLPAPRCNHAVVYVNGAPFGLYANVEAEDKTFLRRWFESDAGNLYEEGQVDFEPGNEARFDLETNEEKNDRSDLTALIAALSSTEPETFLEDVGAELDMAHFLKFTAAEAAVNQWDMYAYTVFYPNNFRVYRDPVAEKFVMLPWGMDMSMKPYRDSGRPHILPLRLSHQYDMPMLPITAGRIFRDCLESAPCRAAYIPVVLSTAALYESAELESLAKKFFAQAEPHIAEDVRQEFRVLAARSPGATGVDAGRRRPVTS
jgi:hypothetical protein